MENSEFVFCKVLFTKNGVYLLEHLYIDCFDDALNHAFNKYHLDSVLPYFHCSEPSRRFFRPVDFNFVQDSPFFTHESVADKYRDLILHSLYCLSCKGSLGTPYELHFCVGMLKF